MVFLGEILQIWRMPLLREEAGVSLAEPNNNIFNFENGYKVPQSSHKGFSSWNEGVWLFSPLLAQEGVNSLTG